MKQHDKLVCLALSAVCCCAAGCAATIDRQKTTLQLLQPSAQQVMFHSSLNDFQGQLAKMNTAGYWIVSVDAQRPFRYFFSIDGEILLPDCQYRERDDFGGENCIYIPEL